MTDGTPNTVLEPLDWSNIDTVFLDMDGTLLDLNYDNHVWNEVVPSAYADARQMPLDEAKTELLDHMQDIYGTIDFYSFEYWHEFTGLNLRTLHADHDHLVAYRPGALEFLRWLTERNKVSIIATNAHPDSVAVKDAKLDLSVEVTSIVSSQYFRAPKEDVAYWQGMQSVHPFDPERSLFIDDHQRVLQTAQDYGIGHLYTIHTPDSARPARHDLSFPAFDHFDDLT